MSQVKPLLPQAQKSVAVGQPRKISRWEAVFRASIVAALLLSMGMAWWTLTRKLVPLQEQSQALGVTLSRLSSEVDALEVKWSKDEVNKVRAQYKQIRTELFASEEAMGEWINRLDESAQGLDLDLHVVLGKPVPQVTNEVQISVVPASVSIEVHPIASANESPYQRLLRFGQQLSTEGKRADLAELSVVGGTASITRALLVFNLWAGDDSAENKTASIR